MEASLQRLFTTFADGWPGAGLLVQRLVIAMVLLHSAFESFSETTNAARAIPEALSVVLALLIMVGLWTPITGVLIAAVEVWSAHTYRAEGSTAIVLATFGAALAMIGPGAFSIDALLFGRKHIGD